MCTEVRICMVADATRAGDQIHDAQICRWHFPGSKYLPVKSQILLFRGAPNTMLKKNYGDSIFSLKQISVRLKNQNVLDNQYLSEYILIGRKTNQSYECMEGAYQSYHNRQKILSQCITHTKKTYHAREYSKGSQRPESQKLKDHQAF